MLAVPFVLQHRGELIGEQRPGTGVAVVDIQPLEPTWQDNPAFVAPVPGATPPPESPDLMTAPPSTLVLGAAPRDTSGCPPRDGLDVGRTTLRGHRAGHARS